MLTLLSAGILQGQQDSAIAQTRFHGERWITTTWQDSTYLLTEVRDGTPITTYNAKTVSIFDLTQELTVPVLFDTICIFSDDDNVWDNANPQFDEIAADVHWSVEQTHDYFNEMHQWPGMDGQNGAIRSLLHLGIDWDEAFHLPPPFDMLGFGDGGPAGPNATLDVVAHEYTHGVVHHAAGLLYVGESSVLDEGIADIFGTVVKLKAELDFLADPWILAEQQGGYRSISDPKSFGQPDTYQGEFWYDGDNIDIFGHQNNGVLNYWFYLLVEGDQGMNDHGYAYEVTPIGLDLAAQVVFVTLRDELGPLATIEDFADGTKVVLERLGEEGEIVASLREAWEAVGVQLETTSAEDVNSSVPFSVAQQGDQLLLSLDATIGQQLNVSLLDYTGRRLLASTLDPREQELSLSVGGLVSGVYVLHILGADHAHAQKIYIH